MSYVFKKIVKLTFEKAIEEVTAKLGEEGFGVLTEIDVRGTLKKKLDVDFRNYRILGACNPHFAYKALQEEAHVGAMLPCNVIVQEYENGDVEVAAIDPMESMRAIDNNNLAEIATQVRSKLENVVTSM